MDDLASCLKDSRSEGVFLVYSRKRIVGGVMGKGNSVCLQHQRCWEFAFQYIPAVIVTTWGDAGDQRRVKVHEDHMKMKGIRYSLELLQLDASYRSSAPEHSPFSPRKHIST